jgi:hypothetical protein
VPRRDRVRRRSAAARWAGRVLGILGTAVVLACGAVIATMVLGDADEAVSPAPAATPPAARGDRPARLTRAQRAERRRALAELRGQGYRPLRPADFDARHLLRVLIGEPAGRTPPGRRAFFFVDGKYIGHDAASPSGRLRAGRAREREVTLVYTLYRPGDALCCPRGGQKRVRFRWTGDALRAREPIPPPRLRLPAG